MGILPSLIRTWGIFVIARFYWFDIVQNHRLGIRFQWGIVWVRLACGGVSCLHKQRWEDPPTLTTFPRPRDLGKLSIPLLLTADAMWPVHSNSYLCDFVGRMDCTLELPARQTLSSLSCSCQGVLSQQWEKKPRWFTDSNFKTVYILRASLLISHNSAVNCISCGYYCSMCLFS